MSPSSVAESAIARTRAWVDRAVIGLNLCPFAKSVVIKNQVRYVVYEGEDTHELLDVLRLELEALAVADPEHHDTTLIIATGCLSDFWDFNGLLSRADRVLRKAGLEGTLQIANFHPQYQFMDAEPDALSNYTNRAPLPTLHLLRESSLDRAVQAFPNAELIFEKNIQTLEQLGHGGWEALGLDEGDLPLKAPTPPRKGKKT
jgi:uncharacterized protein